MPSGCARSASATTPPARPARRHISTSPATSAGGRSQWVAVSQPIHSVRNVHGGRIQVSAAGSLTPPSQPTSPPSTLAAAVAGYKVPAVDRLNSAAGATATTVTTANAATRRSVTARAKMKNGMRRRASGRASVASAAHAADASRRSCACARRAAATRHAASATSMPESAPQATGPVHRSAMAATSATSVRAPQASAARRVRMATPRVMATPSALAISSEGEEATAPAASRSVQRGAVEPATGVPGLKEKPAPSARLRANWRWIHESSSGNPEVPAICRSRTTKRASGSSAAATTRRSSRHQRARAAGRSPRSGTRGAVGTARGLRADEGVVLVVDGPLAQRQHVEVAAVRDLDLDEPFGPPGHRAPVVDEPDEALHRGRKADLGLGDCRHGRREARRSETGDPTADLELIDRVLGQVEHGVAEPRVRARIALLGDHDSLLSRVQPTDRVDEPSHDVFVLAHCAGGSAEDPVERLVLRLTDPGGSRRIEVPGGRPRRPEARTG